MGALLALTCDMCPPTTPAPVHTYVRNVMSELVVVHFNPGTPEGGRGRQLSVIEGNLKDAFLVWECCTAKISSCFLETCGQEEFPF